MVERKNKTLLEMLRTRMSNAILPISFWGYTLEIATYFLKHACVLGIRKELGLDCSMALMIGKVFVNSNTRFLEKD